MSKIYLVSGSRNSHQWCVKAFLTQEEAENYAEELDMVLDTVETEDDLEIFHMFYDPNLELGPQKVKYYVEELERE